MNPLSADWLCGHTQVLYKEPHRPELSLLFWPPSCAEGLRKITRLGTSQSRVGYSQRRSLRRSTHQDSGRVVSQAGRLQIRILSRERFTTGSGRAKSRAGSSQILLIHRHLHRTGPRLQSKSSARCADCSLLRASTPRARQPYSLPCYSAFVRSSRNIKRVRSRSPVPSIKRYRI